MTERDKTEAPTPANIQEIASGINQNPKCAAN